MFNTPVLDVAIGLVFIFLLYSLLATSVNEAIATGLSLRARMLRKAIMLRMLSNTDEENKILNFLKGFAGIFTEIVYIFGGAPEKQPEDKNIGDQFYSHPIIKNYASSSFFKIPSYLAASNFAIILIESLKEDFNNKVNEIAAQKFGNGKSVREVLDELNNSPDIIKIKELLDYYAWYYAANPGIKTYNELPGLPRGLDKEIHCILQLHLRNSLFDFNAFNKKIEGWYNDTMDRVSGWYKRQTQFILFVLGFVLAFIFNVDTVAITNKLSTDKDARDQMVQLAVQSADLYKNDPRVQKQLQPAAETNPDSLLKLSQGYLNEAKKTLDSSLKNPNMVAGLGWGEYGQDDPAFIRRLSAKCFHRFLIFGRIKMKDSLDAVSNRINKEITLQPTVNKDSLILVQFYKEQVKNFPVRIKTSYIFYSVGTKKILGFIITAFAICLGAPFWFDLLNKLIKMRGAGNNNNSSNTVDLTAAKETSTTAINTTTSTQNTSEEAVG